MSWRLARSLETLRAQFDEAYPDRNKASDGTIGDEDHQNRQSDHNPWYGPGIVTAIDITHDPEHGVDIDKITDELAASRDPRIKYVIANSLILDSRPGNSPWQWVAYSGSNPHTRHFHLSVVADERCDDASPWDLPSLDGTGNGGGGSGGGGKQPAGRGAPPYPLPPGYYYGPLSGPAESISGKYRTDTNAMRAGLRRWQQRLADLGWSITPDGYYGPETQRIARRFQQVKGLHVDGLIGPVTWDAAWTK